MDPFLEVPGDWRDFHARFLNHCADALSDVLPENYLARIEEQFQILERPESVEQVRYPDVSITRTRPTLPPGVEPAPGAIGTITPVAVPLKTTLVEEVMHRWVEIRRKPNWVPVTIIELLSPSNKVGTGFLDDYRKHLDLLQQDLHLVELDLLLGGNRLPVEAELPGGDYFAFVSRVERRPWSEVYAWSIRDPLPTIPVPLLAPDPDVPLDLASVFATVYQKGRYERSIDHDAPLGSLLPPEHTEWVRSVIKAPD
jgi:hypothetical protein